jgi:AAA family ATP:ADP antiporter
MRDRLFKLLGVEAGEESMVSMLLAQSVFIGIFFGAFDISAHSLFLSIFDEKMMAKGYVISGLAGIILTSAYTGLQTRMQFRNFSTINLIFVAAATLLLWILLLINPEKWVVFIVFIMLGPLNILAMLGFWGTTGRLFTLRQGKRLFGLIDSGMVVGIILSCYAIPLLLTFNFSPHNILLISAFAVFIGSTIQILIGRRFDLRSDKGEKQEVTGSKRSVTALIRSDSYIRVMAIFIALSVMTAFFVQYSFMAVTREQYPSEQDMARFLGLFTGSMMIFTLLIKLTVFSYLIRNYGLRTCLAVSPVLVAAFTLIAVLVGMLMGFTPATSGFMLFFMLLALSRLFSKSLKDSIESPSFKVIYQTIDEKIRYGVQSAMDGTVNEIAALTSGLVLAGLGILSFVKLIHFSWVLFALTIIWIYYAVKLYSEYRKSIRKALESGRKESYEEEISGEKTIFRSRFSAEQEFNAGYLSLISGDLSSLEKNKNKWYIEKIIDHSDNKKDLCMLPALNMIAEKKDVDEGTKHRALKVAEDLEQIFSSGSKTGDRLNNARKILADTKQPQTTQILRLLRDNNIQSKEIAINMIGKFRLIDMLAEVCECLDIKGLENLAANVLKSFGKDAGEEVTKKHMISSGNINVGNTTLRLLGEESSGENDEFLFTRLWSNSRQLKETALESLVSRHYKVREDDKDRLHQMISDVIGIMVWNISSHVCLQRENNDFLLEQMNKEIVRWNRFLFNLLAITYDPGSVNKIRENLESSTLESVNFALEMIDIVIDESIKPKLIPLVDIIPDEDKVKALFQFFPGEIPDYDSLLENIINRDYNFLGIWIRACVIRTIQKIDNENLEESLKALLFSPEPILREESAMLANRLNKELYKSTSGRLSPGVKEKLDKITRSETPAGEMLYEKTKFLSECFTGLTEEDLLLAACNLKYIDKAGPEDLIIEKDSILWPVSSGLAGDEAQVIYTNRFKGKIKTPSGDYDHWYLLPMEIVEEYNFRYPEKAVEILKYIESHEN